MPEPQPPEAPPPAEHIVFQYQPPAAVAEAARRWLEDRNGWEELLRSQGDQAPPDALAWLRREYANLQARLGELQTQSHVWGLPNPEPADPVCALRWAVGRAVNELAILNTPLLPAFKRRPAKVVDWTGLVQDLYRYVRKASAAGAGPLAPPAPEAVSGRPAAARAIDLARRWCETLEGANERVTGGGAAEDTTYPDRGSVSSIRLVGEIWRLRYQGESGDYPVRGNQSIGWLHKLLGAPNRVVAVADLRGDPEGKLNADAMLGAEPEMDREALEAAKRRLEEIEEVTAATGGSEQLQEEAAQLLCSLKEGPRAKTLKSQLKRDHANIATQLRSFRRKLEADMPQLAAHLKASLKLEFPQFGYYPPDPPPNWQF